MGISFGTGFQVIVLLYYILLREDYMYSRHNSSGTSIGVDNSIHEGEGLNKIISFPSSAEDDKDGGEAHQGPTTSA